MENEAIHHAALAAVLLCTTPVLAQPANHASLAESEEIAVEAASGEKACDEETEKEALRLTNQERAATGLPVLEWSPELAEAARFHAKDMSEEGYFSHFSCDRVEGKLVEVSSPQERLLSFSVRACAENIAQGQSAPRDVIGSWMASENHRKNILAADHRTCGIGFAGGYWVQVFGR